MIFLQPSVKRRFIFQQEIRAINNERRGNPVYTKTRSVPHRKRSIGLVEQRGLECRCWYDEHGKYVLPKFDTSSSLPRTRPSQLAFIGQTAFSAVRRKCR